MGALRQQLEALQIRIDGMSLRERGLLFFALLVVLFMLWDALLMAPLEAKKEAKLARLDAVRSEIAGVNGKIQSILERQNSDPNVGLRRELVSAQRRVGLLDQQIGEEMAGLIGPQQMARALEEMLLRQTDLTPLRVENLGSTPLIAAADEEAGVEGAGAYRHRLLLEMEGSYLQAIDYLRTLQTLPWSFYWDEITIEMGEYPNARIRVVVSTLSLREGWIGA